MCIFGLHDSALQVFPASTLQLIPEDGPIVITPEASALLYVPQAVATRLWMCQSYWVRLNNKNLCRPTGSHVPALLCVSHNAHTCSNYVNILMLGGRHSTRALHMLCCSCMRIASEMLRSAAKVGHNACLGKTNGKRSCHCAPSMCM